MTYSLNGARAKIARARQHAEELEREIDTFLKDNPYPIIRESEPDGSKHVFRIENPKTAPVALWGLIVGDIVHNLRSALDHIAWQLSSKHSGTPPTGTEFPVFRECGDFHSTNRHGRPTPRSGLYKVRGMGPEVRTFIETLQPYHTGNPLHDPLWFAHALDILDKHKIIPVVIVTQEEIEINWQLPPGGLLHNPAFHIFPYAVEHNAVIAIAYVDPPNPEVQVKAKFAFTVVFDESVLSEPRVYVRENLRGLVDRFSSIPDQFESFLK